MLQSGLKWEPQTPEILRAAREMDVAIARILEVQEMNALFRKFSKAAKKERVELLNFLLISGA